MSVVSPQRSASVSAPISGRNHKRDGLMRETLYYGFRLAVVSAILYAVMVAALIVITAK